MELWEQIVAAFPELSPTSDFKGLGIIMKDDGDGIVYIEKWEYTKPLPAGLKVGK